MDRLEQSSQAVKKSGPAVSTQNGMEGVPIKPAELEALRFQLVKLKNSLSRVIRGKEHAIDLLLVGLLAGGSVLMEDVPGVGKTTLAKALASSLDTKFRRVQFTPDLLPSDILGASVYNPNDGSFTFREGPIFSTIVLADEINRASPRTQSALLEAMSEGQVTIEGIRYPLPVPFLVLATQNPVDFHGTYPLPEAQLDRFLVQLKLGYPNREMELEILYDRATVDDVTAEKTMTMREVAQLQAAVRQVRMERSIAEYLVDLVTRTRQHPLLKLGVSPRGSQMFFRAIQACAFISGREYVVPDDVQKMAVSVLAHRLVMTPKAKYGSLTKEQIIEEILKQFPVPA